MSNPAYCKALVARRNAGERIGDVVVAVGWPSARLKRWAERSPFGQRTALLATPDRHADYSFGACIGLSCLVWTEQQQDRARAAQIAESLCVAGALRVAVIDADDGGVDWFRTAAEWRTAA